MSERMNKEELIDLIETLDIDKEEFWVLSSGALVLRGIYKDAGDLDIGVSEAGLEQLKKRFNLIEKGNCWFIVNDLVECVVDTKDEEKIGKCNVENINRYYNYLIQSSREKDKLRVPLVEEYMKKRNKK